LTVAAGERALLLFVVVASVQLDSVESICIFLSISSERA